MASKSKMLYIFDIKNTQEDYAWCLMAINAIEETDVESKGASRFTVLKESADKISIAGKRLQFNGSKRYYEYPLRDSQGEKLIIDYKSGELRKLTSNLVSPFILSFAVALRSGFTITEFSRKYTSPSTMAYE